MVASHTRSVYYKQVMAKRGFKYYSALIWCYYILRFPGILFNLAASWCCQFRLVQGMRVLDSMPGTLDHFTTVVDSALTLISKSDPVRFRRVQQEIRSIVNTPAAAVGSCYARPLKVCSVDLRCFYDEDDSNMTVKLLASALIYEATFGHLLSRGVLRTKRNHARFDRLWCKEPQRFLQRLGMASTPWDPEHLVSKPSGPLLMKHVAGEIHGVFTRDHAAESAVWEKTTKDQNAD